MARGNENLETIAALAATWVGVELADQGKFGPDLQRVARSIKSAVRDVFHGQPRPPLGPGQNYAPGYGPNDGVGEVDPNSVPGGNYPV